MNWFRRKPDEVLGALVGQVQSAGAGVRTAVSLVEGELTAREARDQIEAIESEGDEARSRLVSELNSSLGPPIDHEDMFRLSRSIDDVLDNVRDLIAEIDLFGEVDLQPLLGPLEPISGALAELDTAIGMLADDPKGVSEVGLKAQKQASQVRKRYQECLGELFSQESVTVELLASRELLRRLDVIGLRLQEATAALSDGLVKRGLA